MKPETAIHAALMERVQGIGLTFPIAWPGLPSDPQGEALVFDQSGTWLRVSQLRNRPVRWALDGAEPLNRMGFLQVDLFTRIDAASWQVTADGLAEEIAAHFPRDLRLTRDGVTAVIVQADIQPGRRDPSGTHWHTPIVIEYRATA